MSYLKLFSENPGTDRQRFASVRCVAAFLARCLVRVFPASLLLGAASRAADWSCGFEATEGFVNGQPATAGYVSLLGGQATVMSGGAAEGAQFIRFVPQKTDNALILTLPGKTVAGQDRAIRFACRLTGDPEKTRLVLSGGQTVSLQLAKGGVQLEAGDKPPQKVTVALNAGAWLWIELRENATAQIWDLAVNDTMALRALPMQEHSDAVANLLIFSDGTLDLDAVQVTALVTPGGTVSPSVPAGKAGSSGPATADPVTTKTADQKRTELGQALDCAKTGNIAVAVGLVSSAVKPDSKTAPGNLEMAQTLAMLAFAQRDEGRYHTATVLANEALQYLQQARDQAAKGDSAARQAKYEFVAAQITEGILWDDTAAAQLYRKAIQLDASHAQAKDSLDLLTRKQDPGGKNGGSAGKGGNQ